MQLYDNEGSKMRDNSWEEWKKQNGKETSKIRSDSESNHASPWEKWKKENAFASPQEKQTAMRKRYYEASGIDSLRTDFQRYSASAYSYLTQRHKPAGTLETENYQKQNAQWKQNLQNERSYFEKYAKYFSEDDLAAFNKEMDYYEKLLGSYDAVLGSDTAVEDYIAKRLSNGTEAIEQTMETETMEEPKAIENGTVLPRDMALAAMGFTPLHKEYSALFHDPEGLWSGNSRVGTEQAEAYSDRIDGVTTDIDRARIFLTANKASFTDEEYRWLSAYLESTEADTGQLRETAQAYKNATAWENPLNGRKIIFPSSKGVDVNGDGFADTAIFGGELAASRMKQTWDEIAPKIVEEGTRKNFYFQSAQEQTDYAMEYSGELQYAAQHSDENGYYDDSGIGQLSAQYLLDGSITYTDTKKGMTPMEAEARWEELNERVWYLLYAGVLGEDEFEQLLTEVYTARDAYLEAFPSDGTEYQREMNAAMVLTLPEDKNELMREFRYQTGITREGLWQDAYRMQATKSMPGMPDVTTDVPRRYSTEELFNGAEARFGASFYSADASYREIQDHFVLGYLANAKLTQEEYDRYMKLLDRYEAKGFYSQDIAQFRAQRERNGLHQNLSGQQAALEWYPNAGGETFVEGLVLGGEDARDFLFDTAPAAVDTALTRGVGYAAIGIGKALSWLGVDAGEGIADFGDEMTEYKNPRIEEAAQWQYNRHRQYGEKIGNEEKVWKWVYERLPALSNTLTMMGAAGVIGNTVAGTAGAVSAGGSGAVTSPLAANTVRATVYNDFLAATAGIGTTAWAVKNAKLLSMAGVASIGDYVEQLGKDSTPTQRVTHALAAGAMEYISEKLFGGNPLLDDEAGALTKLVYRLTENETIRELVSSAAMDWLGEGFEEVISSVGMMGVDYAMYGKSDATLGQFVDDFTMGILVSTIMLGGSKTVEAFCRTDQYGHLKHITQFDRLAQSDLSALNGQMAQYMIRYCCGDEELMRSNGMSEAEIRKAKAAWEKVLAEYNSVYDSLKGAEAYEIAQGGGGEVAGQAAQTLALSSEGRLGDTDIRFFSTETALEDADEVTQAWTEAFRSAVQGKSASAMMSYAANAIKLAQAAQTNLDIAHYDGQITEQAYARVSNELQWVSKTATETLQGCLNQAMPGYRYGSFNRTQDNGAKTITKGRRDAPYEATAGAQGVRDNGGRQSALDSGEQAARLGESKSQRAADTEGTGSLTEAERASLREQELRPNGLARSRHTKTPLRFSEARNTRATLRKFRRNFIPSG